MQAIDALHTEDEAPMAGVQRTRWLAAALCRHQRREQLKLIVGCLDMHKRELGRQDVGDGTCQLHPQLIDRQTLTENPSWPSWW